MSCSRETLKERRIMASAGNIAMLFATSAGLSLDFISEKIGLDTASLMDTDGYMSEDFLVKLFIMLAETFPDKNICLEMARVAPFSFFGHPWRLLRQAPDTRSFLDIAAPNADLFSDRLVIELIDIPGERIIRPSHPMDKADGGVIMETGIGVLARLLREYFDDKALSRVRFRNEPLSAVSIYEEFFGVPVSFNAEFNDLILRDEALDSLNRKVRPKMKTSIERSFKHLRRELDLDETDEIGDIREAIAQNTMKGDYSVSGLADSMRISRFHLHRRARNSGVGARELLEETRLADAMELLADKTPSIEEVGELLGFDSERGFRKAFERWTQKSPAQFRKEMDEKEE